MAPSLEKTLEKIAVSGAGIEVHAVDPMIYLVFQRTHEHLEPVVDANGATLAFRSRYAALAALRDAGVQELEFIHRSAYGEMVGIDDQSGANEFRERVRL